MKLAAKLAGVCGSGAFILISYASYFRSCSVNPEEITNPAQLEFLTLDSMRAFNSLYLAVLGALFAGFAGYHIGQALSKPQGTSRRRKKQMAAQKLPQNKGPQSAQVPMIASDETFLEDVGLTSYQQGSEEEKKDS